MKWWIFLLVALPMTCGAVKLSGLHKPDHDEYFVLEKDYTHIEHRGLRKIRSIEGLRAGTYTLVAEDKQGQWFLGPVNCIIIVSNESAKKYEETGEIPTLDELNQQMGVPTTGIEGVWLPREGVKQEAKMFMEIRSRTNGGSYGLIGTAIASLTEGTLLKFSFDGVAKHFSEIPRIAGTPPAADPPAP